MFRNLFKGYVVLESIFDIVFIVLLIFVVCMVVYYKQLYEHELYLFSAAAICVALLFGLYRTIRDLINLE